METVAVSRERRDIAPLEIRRRRKISEAQFVVFRKTVEEAEIAEVSDV